MTLKEKMEYLGRYRKSVNEYHKAKEELDRLNTWATNISPTVSDMPSSSTNSNKFDEYVEKKEALKASIECIKAEQRQYELNTKQAINSIQDEDAKRYLSYYYLFFMTWEEAAEIAGYEYKYFREKCKSIIDSIYFSEITLPTP